MDAWDSFCQTGRISDYLQYKQQQDRNKTVNSAETPATAENLLIFSPTEIRCRRCMSGGQKK